MRFKCEMDEAGPPAHDLLREADAAGLPRPKVWVEGGLVTLTFREL